MTDIEQIEKLIEIIKEHGNEWEHFYGSLPLTEEHFKHFSGSEVLELQDDLAIEPFYCCFDYRDTKKLPKIYYHTSYDFYWSDDPIDYTSKQRAFDIEDGSFLIPYILKDLKKTCASIIRSKEKEIDTIKNTIEKLNTYV